MITHLVDPAAFAGDDVRVDGDAYRHLFRSRRLAVGDTVRVVDGAGNARWSTVTSVARKEAVLTLGAVAPDNEARYQLQLVVAAPRKERASWLVEKATELGVASIRFVASERTPRQYGEGNLARLRRVAGAALAQCHRAAVPTITGVHGWDEVEGLLQAFRDRWYLDPESDTPGELAATALAGTVLIGPEGGWSPDEQKTLARWATPVGLGPRILRVETAAIVAAARLIDRP